MTVLSPTRRRSASTNAAFVPARVRQGAPATRSSPEQRLAEARMREDRARRDLALAIARAERTYALAVRNLEEFDEYLSGVRARLQKAGYLASTGRSRSTRG